MPTAKNNIIAFVGKNLPARQDVLSAWIKKFSEKYGEHNISRSQTSQTNMATLQEITTPSLLGEKRLFIFQIEPEKKKK